VVEGGDWIKFTDSDGDEVILGRGEVVGPQEHGVILKKT